jgi:thiamine transport system ATP-binding protein
MSPAPPERGDAGRLQVDAVRVVFDGRTVLDEVSLDVGAGEVVALQGPSGAGKSTLLRVIAGLLPTDGGRVLIDGRDVTAAPTHRRGIGMVFQDNQLFPQHDVAGNIGFGLRVQRLGRRARGARVDELLALVGLAGFGTRSVTSLSGGEAKRVALARSLAPCPRVLLLDEPLTGLDAALHDELAATLAGVLRATRTTALLVTHDVDEAATIADRTCLLADLSAR